MIVLIPAYEPDGRLVALVASIRAAAPDLRVMIVDDGSGGSFARVFDDARALGCAVLGYPGNRGKGAALKAGFAHAASAYPGEAIVCADCDGQHDVADILRVADRVRTSSTSMILGSRRFTGRVPARSRLGNAATALAFRLATNRRVHDTQTGLRGYPASMLGWLQTISGDRFEYELNLLLHATEAGYCVEEVEIATIYLEDNASSHFRPVADSLRIYAPLAAFALSSIGAFTVDAVALVALNTLTGALLPSVIGARVISGTLNFRANRRLVFNHGSGPDAASAARYWSLAVVLLAANFGALTGLTAVGVALVPAKLLTEAALWGISYRAQRLFVFAAPPAPPGAPRECAGSGRGPLRRNPPEKIADLDLGVPPVTAQGADRRELSGLRPPGHGLRVDAEEAGNLGGSEQRLGLGRREGHGVSPGAA